MALTLQEIEAAINSDEEFAAYVVAQDTHPDNIALDLIGAAYELDGDDLADTDLIVLIQDILDVRKNWLSCHQ
jgi:hypothetical protein